MQLRVAAQLAAGLVYPRRCPFCDRVLGWMPDCPDCAAELAKLRRTVPRLPATEHILRDVTGAAAVWRYDGCVRQAILRFKNGGRACYGETLGAEMARAVFGCNYDIKRGIITFNGVPPLARFDLVVPVPSSERGRGYEPPELLAVPLARALGIPLEKRALRKTRVTHTQKGLSAAERLQNLRGAFCVRNAQRIEGRRILLVDDVITTGATISTCAAALMRAGALEVFAVAAAHTEL